MSPTGVALRDAREQLFAAAERIIVRDGASALTSRSVTTEAGCAKGVLHRHFTDFDTFCAELVGDRIVRMRGHGIELHERAGTGSVVDNVTRFLIELFDPVVVGLIGLVIFRDGVRERLRDNTSGGMPIAAEAGDLIMSYLDVEELHGRIDALLDRHAAAMSLIGSAHLTYADRAAAPPTEEAVRTIVAGVLGPAVREP